MGIRDIKPSYGMAVVNMTTAQDIRLDLTSGILEYIQALLGDPTILQLVEEYICGKTVRFHFTNFVYSNIFPCSLLIL